MGDAAQWSLRASLRASYISLFSEMLEELLNINTLGCTSGFVPLLISRSLPNSLFSVRPRSSRLAFLENSRDDATQ